MVKSKLDKEFVTGKLIPAIIYISFLSIFYIFFIDTSKGWIYNIVIPPLYGFFVCYAVLFIGMLLSLPGQFLYESKTLTKFKKSQRLLIILILYIIVGSTIFALTYNLNPKSNNYKSYNYSSTTQTKKDKTYNSPKTQESPSYDLSDNE